jgi:hypothetical protein
MATWTRAAGETPLRSAGSLREKALWKDQSHASSAAAILGRMAGIEEQKLQVMIWSGKVQEVVNAAQ